MNAGKRLIGRLATGLGLAILLVAFAASPASAYPPGTAPTITGSASTVTQGGTLTVSGSGFFGTVTFAVGVEVLGSAEATGPNGTFTKTLTIRSSDFAAGNYTIVATDSLGDRASFSFSVEAASGGTGGSGGGSSGGGGGLASTGVAVLTIGGLGVLMLIGGGVMLMVGKRRKATV